MLGSSYIALRKSQETLPFGGQALLSAGRPGIGYMLSRNIFPSWFTFNEANLNHTVILH